MAHAMNLIAQRAKEQTKKKKTAFMNRNVLKLSYYVTMTVPKTLVQRAIRGPIYPTWSIQAELFYGIVEQVMDKHYLLTWEQFRHFLPLLPLPKASHVYHKIVHIDNIKAEYVAYIPKHLRQKHKSDRSHPHRHEAVVLYMHGGGFCLGNVPLYR